MLILVLAASAWGQMLQGIIGAQASSSAPTDSISYVNSANLGGSTTTSFSASYTAGSGTNRLLVIAFAGDTLSGHDDITGVSFNGVSATFGGKRIDSDYRMLYVYYLLNPASGAHNVVVTCTNSHWIDVIISEYAGVAQTGQLDVSTTATTSGPNATATVTTTSDYSWGVLLGGGDSGDTLDFLGGTNCTRRVNDTYYNLMMCDTNGPKHPAGSLSMTWHFANSSSHSMGSILLVFKATS